MAENSKIEWTDATWIPLAGCDAISPGCANCYAATMAARLESMGQEKYQGLAVRKGGKGAWTGRINFSEADLLAPLKKRKPTQWFLTSMGDVFHDGVPDEFIDRLFAVMALTPHHTYYVLTKRPDRAANYLTRPNLVWDAFRAVKRHIDPEYREGSRFCDDETPWRWPLRNVLIGCTAEDQPRADERRPHMERIAAAGWRTFVSYEPALGMVDWTGWEFLALLIGGGESGPHARPPHPDWFRVARDWCAPRSIPFFFKQWGEWAAVYERDREDPRHTQPMPDNGDWDRLRYVDRDGSRDSCGCGVPGLCLMRRVGKKAAGRLLDGVLHDAVPKPR